MARLLQQDALNAAQNILNKVPSWANSFMSPGTAQQPEGQPEPDGIPGRGLNDLEPQMEEQPVPAQQVEIQEPVDNYEQIRQMQVENQKRLQPYLDRQEAGLGDMERMVAKYKSTPKEMDISPLAALVDTMTGSQLAQTIKKPKESNLDKAENIAALTNLLQKERGALTAAQARSLSDIGIRGLESAKRQQRADTGIAAKFGQGIIADTKGINKEFNEASGKLDKLEATYKTGDLKQITSILGDMAKYVGGNLGATSDADAARQLYNTMNKTIADWTNKFGGTGIIPESELKSYMDLIQRSRNITGDIYKNKYGSVKEQYASQAEALGKPELLKQGGAWDKYFSKQAGSIKQGFQPMESRAAKPAGYSDSEEAGISKVMKSNGLDRESAINALKGAGKLK